MKIFLANHPVDFRKGIDGLAGFCRNHLDKDPFSGALFVFRNRSGTSLKILIYDGQGFWLCHKRLSKGRFTWWPKVSEEKISKLCARELQILLWNGNVKKVRFGKDWRRLPE